MLVPITHDGQRVITTELLAQVYEQNAWREVMNSLTVNLGGGNKSGSSSKSGGSGKSWFEQQIDALKKLEEAGKRTNEVLEKSEEDTSARRLKNLRELQNKVLAMEKEFMARGKAETSDEVNQLRLMYHGLADNISAIYSDMSDELAQGY